MLDVIVAGAGPAGSLAALAMARAGARVWIVDRETFPRDKLCGDTLNPGAIELLRSVGLAGGPLARAWPLRGMRLTGVDVSVRGDYGGDTVGLALRRRDLDLWLLEAAIQAGARFEPRLVVRGPLLDGPASRPMVRGVVLAPRQSSRVIRVPAILTIGADGRRSTLAGRLGLRVDPPTVRRWAFGVYATGVADMQDVGEMHVRGGWYVGLAPLGPDLVNLCVVTPPRPDGRSPLEVIRRAVGHDAELSARLAHAEFVSAPRVLGPLAADVRTAGAPGLLLAGDAAGFVDPMTGDGLHLAMQGGLLAADVAMRALETGDVANAAARLDDVRRARFGRKVRYNRWVRRLVDTPVALALAGRGARLAPALIARAVRYAGDVR